MRDRLSNLPEDLLLEIISDLPLKSQAETSLFSKRWRNLWRRSPVLILTLEALGLPVWNNDDFSLGQRNCRLIDEFIDQSQAPCLRKLQLEVIFKWIPSASVDRWLRVAAARSVQELCVRYTTPASFNGSPHRLPSSLLDCSPSLSSLVLCCCFLPALPPDFQGFLALKTLHLSMAIIPGDELSRLLLACPLLEGLKIQGCQHSHPLTVACPKLTALALQIYSDLGVIVDCPSLTTISVYGDATVSIKSHVPHLLNASFQGHSNWPVDEHLNFNGFSHMLSLIRHVRVLAVDLHFLKLVVLDLAAAGVEPVAFGGLKELHLNGKGLTDDSLRAIDVFLEKHPLLEIFCMRHCDRPPSTRIYSESESCEAISVTEHHGYACQVPATDISNCKLSLNNTQSYLLPNLKILRVFGFLGTTNEMKLVKLLLASATALESLNLFYASAVPRNRHIKLSKFRRVSMDASTVVAGETSSWMDTIIPFCSSSQTVRIQVAGEHVVKDCMWHYFDCGSDGVKVARRGV